MLSNKGITIGIDLEDDGKKLAVVTFLFFVFVWWCTADIRRTFAVFSLKTNNNINAYGTDGFTH